MITLSTIGYEGASLDDFLATLRIAGVQTVIDVREVPQSRRPGYSKRVLARALEEKGMGYVHFKSLGDPKHGREAARAGRFDEFYQIYNAHVERPEAISALQVVGELSTKEACVLLCYERDPQHCHRSIVANRLSVLYTFQVRHLGVMNGAGGRAQKPDSVGAGISAG